MKNLSPTKIPVSIFTMVLFISTGKAQLVVELDSTPEHLIESFFDTTQIQISNIVYTGSDSAVGRFNSTNTNLGLTSGILLTNGGALCAIGPNDSGSKTCDNDSISGDYDLTNYCGQPTYNASIFEFDLIPNSDTLLIQYVFGSEDYPEWVGTIFNDVFIMLLTGPGYSETNIASIPGSIYPVTVTDINCTQNPQLYICNDPLNTACDDSFNCPTSESETTIQYDGFTVPLSAYAVVTPDQSYHLKIGIADAGDAIYDSGVFLSIKNTGEYTLNSTSITTDYFSVFPIPAVSDLNVQTEYHGQLYLYDLRGRLLYSRSISEREKIDISSYPSGEYLLTFRDGRTVHHKKIMKL